jgi:hypothetical protein
MRYSGHVYARLKPGWSLWALTDGLSTIMGEGEQNQGQYTMK